MSVYHQRIKYKFLILMIKGNYSIIRIIFNFIEKSFNLCILSYAPINNQFKGTYPFMMKIFRITFPHMFLTELGILN